MPNTKKSLSLAKEKIKILLLEGLHNNALQLFDENGYNNVEYLKSSLK
jgi:D-3-phosphoglycerate dehydrogenase